MSVPTYTIAPQEWLDISGLSGESWWLPSAGGGWTILGPNETRPQCWMALSQSDGKHIVGATLEETKALVEAEARKELLDFLQEVKP